MNYIRYAILTSFFLPVLLTAEAIAIECYPEKETEVISAAKRMKVARPWRMVDGVIRNGQTVGVLEDANGNRPFGDEKIRLSNARDWSCLSVSAPDRRTAAERRRDCYFGSGQDLIGLSKYALEQRCGYWGRSNITTTATTTYEQLIYGDPGIDAFYVNVANGVVISVQQRRR